MELAENVIVVGKYRLNRMIGRGGMGSVWHATQLDLDRACAVKFIEGEYATLPEAQERFVREAKAASKISSQNIVQVFEHGIWDGTPFIAMELLEGEDLGHRIQRHGQLSPGETNTILTQVCRALQRAHQAGIVHRDLKPDNIFLVKDDDREVAKIVDFGIAKLGSNVLEGSKTRTGAMLGTPYYMSPEQAQGTKGIDSRSDLWSMAIIAYQCVTGKLPFESEALGDLLVKIIVSPVPVPSQNAPNVPPGFDRWFAKAASRDPAGRFQTAKEFADSLTMALGASSMTDVTDMNALRAAMASTPNPAGMPMDTFPGIQGGTPNPAAPGEAAMRGATGASPLTYSGVTAVGDIDGLPKKKSSSGIIFGAIAAVLLLAVGAAFALKSKGDSAAANNVPKLENAATATTQQTADPLKVGPTETAKPVETVAEKPAETATAPTAATSVAANDPHTANPHDKNAKSAPSGKPFAIGDGKHGGPSKQAKQVDKFGF